QAHPDAVLPGGQVGRQAHPVPPGHPLGRLPGGGGVPAVAGREGRRVHHLIALHEVGDDSEVGAAPRRLPLGVDEDGAARGHLRRGDLPAQQADAVAEARGLRRGRVLLLIDEDALADVIPDVQPPAADGVA
ncbi:MAG: hypothetical protein ACK559_23595, partial [bacterium]